MVTRLIILNIDGEIPFQSLNIRVLVVILLCNSSKFFIKLRHWNSHLPRLEAIIFILGGEGVSELRAI